MAIAPLWQMIIPNWCPPSKNASRGRHWRQGHRDTKACAELLAAYGQMAFIPQVRDDYRPVRSLHIHVSKVGKLPDPQNILNALFDGLKLARLIVDDSDEWLDWDKPFLTNVADQSDARTILTLQDITDEPEHANQGSAERL